MKQKELVTLRKKPMNGGGESLFLDYMIDGVRHKEYLKMYLIPERTKIDKIKNEETMRQAEAKKALMIIDIMQGKVGLQKRREKILFSEFLDGVVNDYDQKGKGRYADGVKMLAQNIKEYNDCYLDKVDVQYVRGFMDYIKGIGKYKDGSIHHMYMMLNTQLFTALRKDLIDINPCTKLERSEKPKQPESTREYLTEEELRTMMATQIPEDLIVTKRYMYQLKINQAFHKQARSAFLFSCFTGLRISDLERLTWDDIRETGHGPEIRIRQKKTKTMVIVPLSANAKNVLPEKAPGLIWPRLNERVPVKRYIDDWTEASGIDKHITFHCARHTFATMLLTSGVDIYTVSKLLGHSDVRQTQVYAKLVDSKRKQAIDMLPDFVGGLR